MLCSEARILIVQDVEVSVADGLGITDLVGLQEDVRMEALGQLEEVVALNDLIEGE